MFHSLNPVQALHSAWPDLDPNSLQRLSVDGKLCFWEAKIKYRYDYECEVNFVFQQHFSPIFRGHWPKNWKVGNHVSDPGLAVLFHLPSSHHTAQRDWAVL